MSDTTEIPFDNDAVVEWFFNNPDLFNDDTLATALSRVGRNYEPQLLMTLHVEGMLASWHLAKHVGSAWSASEYPDKCLDHADWEDLFDAAGYTVDGVPAERPTENLRLYRGSVPERSTDWSWTDNIEVARKYAAGHFLRPVGNVYAAEVPPSALLARNTGRSEDEYVVNTRGLNISVAERWLPDIRVIRPLTTPRPWVDHGTIVDYTVEPKAMEHHCQCCGEIADDVFCDDCKAHMSAEIEAEDSEPGPAQIP